MAYCRLYTGSSNTSTPKLAFLRTEGHTLLSAEASYVLIVVICLNVVVELFSASRSVNRRARTANQPSKMIENPRGRLQGRKEHTDC